MKSIAVGAAAAMFVALTAFIYWLQGGGKFTQPKKAYTHLHCPECQLEMAYNGTLDGKPCPQCGSGGPTMVPTVGPSRSGKSLADMGPAGRILGAGFIALLVELVVAYVWIKRVRARKKAEALEKDNNMLVCRCPFCSRRIGFLAKKLGTATLCPRCKTAFALTAVEAEGGDDSRDSRS